MTLKDELNYLEDRISDLKEEIKKGNFILSSILKEKIKEYLKIK